MHVLFDLMANHWNDAGYDMRVILKPEVPISWSTHTVKNEIWRPVQRILTGKESTTNLERKEIDAVYNELVRMFGERSIPMPDFPSIVSQMLMNQNEFGVDNKNKA